MHVSPLSWVKHENVWEVMLQKEAMYNTRCQSAMDRHPSLTPQMRSTLLSWLDHVAKTYKLHRESFYLATDFFDRYMAVSKDVQKSKLQLLGITCLFIATKIVVKDFAYLTDGACTEEEIVNLELVIMKTLHWELTSATPCIWLNVYLELLNYDERKKDCLVMSHCSQHAFVQIIQLLDLCILEIDSLQFHYSVLAAAALCHMSSREIALQASGYMWSDIMFCTQWMTPFAMTLHVTGKVPLKFVQNVGTNNIQTH